MLWFLRSCKSSKNGEQERRAWTVALRKHRFPKLIKPWGRIFLAIEYGPFDAWAILLLESTMSKPSVESSKTSSSKEDDNPVTLSQLGCCILCWFQDCQNLNTQASALLRYYHQPDLLSLEHTFFCTKGTSKCDVFSAFLGVLTVFSIRAGFNNSYPLGE